MTAKKETYQKLSKLRKEAPTKKGYKLKNNVKTNNFCNVFF
jgi:hypothetical protein